VRAVRRAPPAGGGWGITSASDLEQESLTSEWMWVAEADYGGGATRTMGGGKAGGAHRLRLDGFQYMQ